MKTIIVKDYDELSNLTSSIIIKELKKNKKLVLGLATGSTPIDTSLNEISLALYACGIWVTQVTTFFHCDFQRVRNVEKDVWW